MQIDINISIKRIGIILGCAILIPFILHFFHYVSYYSEYRGVNWSLLIFAVTFYGFAGYSAVRLYEKKVVRFPMAIITILSLLPGYMNAAKVMSFVACALIASCILHGIYAWGVTKFSKGDSGQVRVN